MINLSNCWKSLKTIKLQRSDEICTSVNVTKVEKIDCMVHGANLNTINNGKSAAKH